jgi:hypothetical protein
MVAKKTLFQTSSEIVPSYKILFTHTLATSNLVAHAFFSKAFAHTRRIG